MVRFGVFRFSLLRCRLVADEIMIDTAFWATCASCLPTFRPLLARRSFLYEAIDHLNARDRVVVALFCATGARSTNDLALLGLGEVRRGSSNELGSSIAQAREDICMSIRSCAMGLYDQLEVAFEGATKEGLAVHTASALIMLCKFRLFSCRRTKVRR